MGTGRFPDAFTTAKSLGVFSLKNYCGQPVVHTCITVWLVVVDANNTSDCLLVFVVLLALAPHTMVCGLLGE